jgi:pyruvate formate lyase activating enzyme
MIFNIQRFSTHDGEGIRTVVFYKGCPLRCTWCSNPESQSFGPSLLYDNRLCRDFGECVATRSSAVTKTAGCIEIKNSSSSEVMKLKDVCPTRALVVSGEAKSVDEIISEIRKDISFYIKSGGGVTLSGGEPLSQGPELVELITILKSLCIDVAIETSLHVQWENIERTISYTGTFLADLKHTNSVKFRQFTGGDSLLVMKNLKKLAGLHDKIVIRVPVIPGFNNTLEEMKEIIGFAHSLQSVREINFLPYHNLGGEKYKMTGIENNFAGVKKMNPDEVKDYIKYAESKGLIAKTGG